MIDSVKKYIKKGFSILPTKENKAPAVSKWVGVSLDETNFKNSYGIGVKCGKESNGLECMDFDNHFGDAKQTISEFLNTPSVKEIYSKYKLPIESTVSGGFHLLFRCDYNEGNRKLASKPLFDKENNRWKPDAIIETRGEGGYFVAAPTKGYEVIRNDIFNVQHIEKEERQILIETAISFNQWADPVKNEFESGDKPGDIYNQKSESIDEMKSALMSNGWVEVNKFNWRRPGKKDGISATIGKVADNIFYCFSANAHPFNAMSGYTPFQVIGLLKYNADFKKFASEIAERYELNNYKNTKIQYHKPEVRKKTDDELLNIIQKNFIDVTIPVKKPPVILNINHGSNISNTFKRLLTLGNISSITGKGKSKKTFMESILAASFATNDIFQYKFKSDLPDGKRQIIHIDTEQGEYDTYIVAKRMHDMSGGYQEHLGTWNLREFEPYDRVDIVRKIIDHFRHHLGVVFIDGIADLITNINNEEESTKITSEVMKWTKKYNIHICNIIHQNKNDNYATGHLGSSLIKKSEVVIGIGRDDIKKFRSIVSCQNIRGAEDFDDFAFFIDENGFPKIDWDWRLIKKNYV